MIFRGYAQAGKPGAMHLGRSSQWANRRRRFRCDQSQKRSTRWAPIAGSGEVGVKSALTALRRGDPAGTDWPVLRTYLASACGYSSTRSDSLGHLSGHWHTYPSGGSKHLDLVLVLLRVDRGSPL